MSDIESIDLLLVEDNQNDVELTMRALKSINLANNVHVSRDGREALDFMLGADENGNQKVLHNPKAILLDLKLPRVSGLEVLKVLKSNQETKKIPVVMLTSSQESRDLEDCYKLGANSYIVKPFGFEQFVKAVAEAGLYWLVINQAPAQQGGG
jgi:two-component system response regulator